MYSRHSIANRMSRRVLLISAGLLFVVTLLVGLYSRDIIESTTEEVAGNDLDLAISDIEKVLVEVERAVDNIDWVVESNRRSEQFLYNVTRELVEANPNIIGSAVAFEPGYFKGEQEFSPYSYLNPVTGRIITTQLEGDYDYLNQDWYRVPMELGHACWSEPYFDEGGGNQSMATYSCPLKDEDGKLIGILTSDISLKWLSSRIGELTPYPDSYAFMVSSKGTYIAHPDSTRLLNRTIFEVAEAMNDTTALSVARNMVAGNKGSVRIKGGKTGGAGDVFVVYGPLKNGWSVMLINLYSSVFHRLRLFNLFLVLFLILGLIGMYLGCRKVIRRTTMPIIEFSNAALNIAKGNFKASIPEVDTRDELKQLRNSLEFMQRSINSYITELKSTTASNERYESELNIARQIQMSMLPTDFPTNEKCSLYAMIQPAKEVGGDLYDFIRVGDKLFFMVGDVSGKGVPAALFMAIARAAFRFVGALGLPMEEVVGRVNDCLCDGNKNDMFVTLFAGCLDVSTGELSYCNAGHNPIVVIPPGGKAFFLEAEPNLAAGLIADFPYKSGKIGLQYGSRLVLYTDGVTEAERKDKAQFGDSALLSWAGSLYADASAEAAVVDLYSRVKAFTRGAEQNDDITILSVLLKTC